MRCVNGCLLQASAVVLFASAGGCAIPALGVSRPELPPDLVPILGKLPPEQLATVLAHLPRTEISYVAPRFLMDNEKALRLKRNAKTGELEVEVNVTDKPDVEAIRAMSEGVRDLAALARGGSRIEAGAEAKTGGPTSPAKTEEPAKPTADNPAPTGPPAPAVAPGVPPAPAQPAPPAPAVRDDTP